MGRLINFPPRGTERLPWVAANGRFSANLFDAFVERCIERMRQDYPGRFEDEGYARAAVFHGIRKRWGHGPIHARKEAAVAGAGRELSPSARELSVPAGARVCWTGWRS